MASTLLLGVAAVNTGNNLLFLIVSAMLAFMAVTGFLGLMNIRGFTVTATPPDEVYSGVETLVPIRVENRKRWLPSFLITVALAGHETFFLLLNPRRPESGTLQLPFQGRGLHQLGLARISSPFPVNFFVRYTRVKVPGSFTVFPAPLPLGVPLAAGQPDLGAELPSAAAGYDGDLATITDYRGGESLKSIHWRLSAKHEELKVKQLTSHGSEPVLLEPEQVPGRDLEERLSYASFLVNRLIRGGRPVGLKLGERVIPPGTTRMHRLKLLGELAMYGR